MRLPPWRLTSLTAALILAAVGLITYGSGLAGAFVGDDFAQVVDNIPAHSLRNLPGFFAGSTFYQGAGAHLEGVYYKPLLVSAYSVIYAVAGPNPYAFHLAQLFIFIAGAWLAFLVFCHWLRPGLAFSLSLIFLVHPLNSQTVFSIADLQEPLYFTFGMLAIWLLVRTRSCSLVAVVPVAACLLLSMLAKETGLCFGAVTLVYVWVFDRRRAVAVSVWSALALATYLALKLPAVGLLANPGNAPIDHLSLPGRLLNIPAIWVFYLGKFVWPWHIAHAYYWVVPGPTWKFWLPLALIAVLATLLITAGRAVRRHSPKAFRVYCFFSFWLALGLFFHSQIQPLDLTATLAWFMFPLAGLLGLIGVLVQTFVLEFLLLPRVRRVVMTATGLIVVLFAARTAVRGPDWSNTYTLAARDLPVSREDYPSANLLGYRAAHLGQFARAKTLADQSVATLPTAGNLDTLGVAEAGLGHCQAAQSAYRRSLALAVTQITLQHRAQLTAACTGPRPTNWRPQ